MMGYKDKKPVKPLTPQVPPVASQPQEPPANRGDHVWHQVHLEGGRIQYKCCLCGAVTKVKPPSPTPEEWMPDRYEELTPADRAMCPRLDSGIASFED
jgi:hypothetical protein